MTDQDKATTGAEKPAVWVIADGRPHSGVAQIGRGGWAFGSTSGGKFLTIPGSFHTTPKLGRTPGTAYRLGPDSINTHCALVVPVHHSGVTGTGIAYQIVQQAERRELDLESAVAYEDQEEEAGVLAADDRTTCHNCRAWATEEHVQSEAHWATLDAAGQMVAALLALGTETAEV